MGFLSRWKGLSGLERATYLAQVATVVALLVTVLFSYLGLRESRLAREEQRALFLAEKAPDVILTATSLIPGYLILSLKNEGESVATGVRLQIDTFGHGGIWGTLQLLPTSMIVTPCQCMTFPRANRHWCKQISAMASACSNNLLAKSVAYESRNEAVLSWK